ncbi:ribosomal protection-like ABC-F family protein [Lactovum odontotermitis]
MLIQINKVIKNFGGLPLFNEVNLGVNSGDKIGLVGVNGTGKTTLLRLISGEEAPDMGAVSRKKGLKIGYVEQNQLSSNERVLDYLLASFETIRQLKSQMTALELQLTTADNEMIEKVLSRYGKVQEEFDAIGGFSLEDRILTTLKGLGVEEKAEQALCDLSGGERVRIELTRLLVSEADVLLLDEPTNHLDLSGIKWLENYLKNAKKAVIVVSHDREFLDNVVSKIVEIEDGQLVEYKGNYSSYQVLKKAHDEQLQRDFDLQQREIARLKKLIRQFRQWGNDGDNEKFYKKAKELEHRLEKMERLKAPVLVKNRVKKKISQSEKSGKEILVVQQLAKIMGEKLLFEDVSFTIYKGERIALVGENGTGKSTLLKLITQELEADEGTIKLGESARIGYLPQNIEFEHPENRLVNFVKDVMGNEQKAREELARFGFYASDVSKRLKDLSGGEKVRLYLLELFQKEINLLILDEPTNHLDIYAREEIENILAQYQGTLLAVSHDRYFLKRNFQKTLRVEDGKIEKFDQLIC